MNRAILATIVAAAAPANSPAQPADGCQLSEHFAQPDEQGRVSRRVAFDRSSLAFRTDLKVNTDGARTSYAAIPPNPATTPRLNTIANGAQLRSRGANGPVIATATDGADRVVAEIARQSTKDWRQSAGDPYIDWVGVETYVENGVRKPCIMGSYYVSTTKPAARAKRPDGSDFTACDQARWIDALAVPAVVIPKQSGFTQRDVAGGDAVLMYRPAQAGRAETIVFGIVGDLGPTSELGEATPAMISRISGRPIPPASPKGKQGWHFVEPTPVMTIILPKSRAGLNAVYDDPDANAAHAKRMFVERFGSGSADRMMARVRACDTQVR